MSSTSAAEAERVATAQDALRAKQRARRAAGKFVAPEADDYDSARAGYPELEDECEYDEEDEFELLAAAPEINPRRFGAKPSLGSGRAGARSRRCFNFGYTGHIDTHCLTIRNQPHPPETGRLGNCQSHPSCATARTACSSALFIIRSNRRCLNGATLPAGLRHLWRLLERARPPELPRRGANRGS